MTTTSPVQAVQLPASGPIMLTRMISDRLFPTSATSVVACPHCKQNISVPVPVDKDPEPITWTISQSHPLVAGMKVIRMFLTDDGVEVYSVADDNRAVMRNLVPSKTIRLTEETMPIDVFADELEAAEEDNFPGGDDPDDPDPDDPSKSPAPPAALPANGSAPS